MNAALFYSGRGVAQWSAVPRGPVLSAREHRECRQQMDGLRIETRVPLSFLSSAASVFCVVFTHINIHSGVLTLNISLFQTHCLKDKQTENLQGTNSKVYFTVTSKLYRKRQRNYYKYIYTHIYHTEYIHINIDIIYLDIDQSIDR